MTQYTLTDLLRIMERLRDPETGCPWDLKQSFQSIVPSTLEEAYELADAIESDDLQHVEEELGDLLFQVVFYSQLGRELGVFDFTSVVQGITEKLIRRHPHVFADGQLEGVSQVELDSDEVKANWEAIKRIERAEKQRHGLLDDIPVSLPGLTRAQKLQKRAATVGFDWSSLSDVLDNLESEIAELREALVTQDETAIADEMGDVLFSAVNIGRHLRLDTEQTLRQASAKFERRFNAMVERAQEAGDRIESLTQTELDALWQLVKHAE